MKKLMFFVLSLKMGGSEKAVVRMANALVEDYSISITTLFGGGILEKQLDSRIQVRNFFPVFLRGVARISWKFPRKLLYKLYIHGNYDIEVAVGDGLESYILSGSPNPDKYSWIHMDLSVTGTRPGKQADKTFSAFKKIICVSHSCAIGFQKTHGKTDMIDVAYTPIPVDEIIKMSEPKVNYSEKTLVAVGRLEEPKGMDLLIKAVSMTIETNYQVHIYGEGSQRAALQNLILELHLEERVFLDGEVENPYPYIRGADALLCTSRTETFGFAIVEAMLLLTPVLATKSGGANEIITNTKEGILCDCDSLSIAKGIDKLLNGENDIDLLYAYERACQFDTQYCKKDFEQIINRR